MRKTFTFLVMMLFASLSSFADDYMVAGAGTAAVNGTYTPTGSNNMDGNPVWTNGTYFMSFNGMDMAWLIHPDAYMTFDELYRNRTSSDPNTPPFTGWDVRLGTAPAPNVGLAGKMINYSSTIFTEQEANDGNLIAKTIIITHNNLEEETFTGSVNDDYIADAKAIVTNVPTGLTAHIKLTSTLTCELTLTGTAIAHNNADDVTNLNIAFQNTAFTGGDASDVINNTTDLEINFIEVHTVAAAGADFTTIAAAIAASGAGDIINLVAETFTEQNIIVDKAVTINGQGSTSTIIQANAAYATATGRIFKIVYAESDTTFINDVTIKNGHSTSGAYKKGGAIYTECPTVITNSAIIDNKIELTGIAYIGGAAIYSRNYLLLNSCLIDNNSTINNASSGMSYAAVEARDKVDIVNSTFTNNLCQHDNGYSLGAALLVDKDATITNSSFTNNSCSGGDNGNGVSGGAGINASYANTVTIKNVISYGNSAAAGDDFYRQRGTINAYNSIIGVSADKDGGDAINGISENISTADPLFSALADNGGPTQTLALQTGSPAIDAGMSGSDIPGTDQRGYYANGTRDIGAFEFEGLLSPPCTPNTGIDVQETCDTYTWIDGVEYTESNNTATHTLTNVAGCDSIVTLNLTINHSNTGNDVQEACDTYTWIDGVEYTESNNTATHTLTNVAGCDSIVTLNLTINHSNTGIDVQEACDTYTWIDGVEYTESNNTATHTLTNVAGCDSIVTLNLTIEECLGVYDNGLSNVSIYPNPTNGTFTISSDNLTEYTLIIVRDALGRTITTQEIYNNTHKFDLSNKSKGIYFIEFKNEEETKVSKILVE